MSAENYYLSVVKICQHNAQRAKGLPHSSITSISTLMRVDSVSYTHLTLPTT